MAVTCPKCATGNSDTAKFCKGCGHDLSATGSVQPVAVDQMCLQCGVTNSINAKFCRSCGTPMAILTSRRAPPDPEFSVTEPALMQAPTSQRAAAPVPTKAPDPAKFLHPEANNSRQKRPTYALWGGVGAACLALAGAGYWFMVGAPKSTEIPASASVSPMPATAAPALEPVPVSAAASVPAFEPATAVAAPPAQELAPAALPPTPTPEPKPIARKPVKKPVEPRRAPAPVVVQTFPQFVAPEAATAPVMPSPRAPRPAPPTGPSSPEEACAGRVFIALSMCINTRCQTPKFTNHPQCIKFRQQTKESQDRIYAN